MDLLLFFPSGFAVCPICSPFKDTPLSEILLRGPVISRELQVSVSGFQTKTENKAKNQISK